MESITLDAIDLQLLDLLQHDAAQSNQALAERVHVSPPTCLRRVKRLHDVGLIERQVALLQPDRLAAVQGHGLACIVEVSLDRQSAEALDAFEARAVADAECSSAGACRRGRTLCWWCTRAICQATWRCRRGCSPPMRTCATSRRSSAPSGQNLKQKCLYRLTHKRQQLSFQ